MFCCIPRNNIQIRDEDELKEKILLDDIKKIKKQLFKTKKNNHLGFGISSNVFKVKLREDYVTCKVIKEGWQKQSENEIKILKKVTKLNHPIFPTFICNFKQNLKNVICYSFIPGIDLFTYITEKNRFYKNETLVVRLIRQLLDGLESLLLIDFIHLDIKLENIMIVSTSPFKISLIDLCFCLNYKKETPKSIIGTIGYISPEIIHRCRCYHNTDIWSIGILMYVLLTSEFIFDIDEEDYIYNIGSENRIEKIKNNRLKNLSGDMQYIINKCLVFNTNYRISITGLKKVINDLY